MKLNLPPDLGPQITASVQDPLFSGKLDRSTLGKSPNFGPLLELAQQFAVTPISAFKVGAVAVGHSGTCYLGANMEFAGVPLHASLHAEQSALLNAWMHGETALERLIVSELPCGHCRQFLLELHNAAELTVEAKGTCLRLAELMPRPFTEVRAKGQGLLDSPARKLVSAQKNERHNAQRAINAAQRSYAPYSRSPEGFIIETIGGHHFAGRSAESIAFNPSVPAVTTALNQMNLSAHRDESINHCTHARLATAITHSFAFSSAVMRRICSAPIQKVLMETAN